MWVRLESISPYLSLFLCFLGAATRVPCLVTLASMVRVESTFTLKTRYFFLPWFDREMQIERLSRRRHHSGEPRMLLGIVLRLLCPLITKCDGGQGFIIAALQCILLCLLNSFRTLILLAGLISVPQANSLC